jgi:hypothetical protein
MSQHVVSPRAAALFFIVAAAFIPVKSKGQNDYKEPRNADVDARGARRARIEAGAGNLKVQGRSGINEVQVRGTARADRRGDLADIKLVAERRGDEVFIKVDIPDDNREGWRLSGNYRNMALDLVIEVPSSLELDVDDGSGEAEFVNTGRITLEDGSGEVTIRGTHGDVHVEDGSGNITIDGADGDVRISDGSGEIRVTNVTGDLIVEEDGSGNIVAKDIGGSARVENDGSGNIDVDGIAGNFVVQSDGSGGIHYDTVKGSVDIPNRKRRGR